MIEPTSSEAGTSAVGASGHGVWNLALDLVEPVPRGRLLELAAGGGYLAGRLQSIGFGVVATDLGLHWQRPNIPFVRADLDRPLPFRAQSFDIVVFAEAYGYLESGPQLLREVHRVLKPGGSLIVTIPNILSLQSRIKFLLSGAYRWFPHTTYSGQSKHDLLDTYRDPTRITTLTFTLERLGYEIEQTTFGNEWVSPALKPFGALLRGYLFIENAMRKKRRTPPSVNSSPALFRTNVGVRARRL